MKTAIATWVAPPIWSVPRTWVGERCFILCGGASLLAQRALVPQLQGRVIAVKEGVLLRPDADVVFFAGEKPEIIAPSLITRFKGTYLVVRGKGHPVFPSWSKRIGRTTDHQHWSQDPITVAGFDAGTSAINLAMHFGSTEIIVLGYDMRGGRWFAGEHPHPRPVIPEADFLRHLGPLKALAADAVAKGIRLVNASPISRAPFPYEALEAFL